MLDKGKKASGKEAVWSAEVTAEASRGYSGGFQREPELQWGPWKPETFRLGWGRTERALDLASRKRRKVGHPHLLLWLYFLSLSPGCSQKPTPKSLVPFRPLGSQVLEISRLPPALGFSPSCCIHTVAPGEAGPPREGHSSDCLGLTFMPL